MCDVSINWTSAQFVQECANLSVLEHSDLDRMEHLAHGRAFYIARLLQQCYFTSEVNVP
jgi:hypothetical protein